MNSEPDRQNDLRRQPLAGIARGENADETNDDLPLAEATAPNGGGAPNARDPNDEIPVPIAMWPSEIDERAQVVETLREDRGIEASDLPIDDGVQESRDAEG
jgi:hypothetical protein